MYLVHMSKTATVDSPEIEYFGKGWPEQGPSQPEDKKSAPSTRTASKGVNPTRVNATQPTSKIKDRGQLSTDPGSWLDRARCSSTDVDPDLFFPAGRELPAIRKARVKEALKFCGVCVVREQCADYGLRLHKNMRGIPGIFGGLDEQDRKRLLKKAKPEGAS